MKKAHLGLGAAFLFMCCYCGFSTWAVASDLRPGTDREAQNTVNDGPRFSDGLQTTSYGDSSQEFSPDPDRAGYKNQTGVKLGANPFEGREALAPARNSFGYDAFGRIVEKQVALE
jgi:hypothetical protein